MKAVLNAHLTTTKIENTMCFAKNSNLTLQGKETQLTYTILPRSEYEYEPKGDNF